MNALDLRNALIRNLSASPAILAVGQTGSLSADLIPGKSDIDLFVLCTQIPTEAERRALYDGLLNQDTALMMGVCTGGHWGHGDILVTGGIDVMPMYFTVQEMQTYLTEVLDGRHMEKDGRFYPVGRLASIADIHVLYEKDDAWSALKTMVNSRPTAFFRRWYGHEISQVLDEEDLGRSELRREVLFFHQVLENALDHLLQALYAVNLRYFPSRKRTLTDLDAFALKPQDCGARLLRLIEQASRGETMLQAICGLRQLTAEVKALGDLQFAEEQPPMAH